MTYERPKREIKRTKRVISASETEKYIKNKKIEKLLNERKARQKTFSGKRSIDDIKQSLNKENKNSERTDSNQKESSRDYSGQNKHADLHSRSKPGAIFPKGYERLPYHPIPLVPSITYNRRNEEYYDSRQQKESSDASKSLDPNSYTHRKPKSSSRDFKDNRPVATITRSNDTVETVATSKVSENTADVREASLMMSHVSGNDDNNLEELEQGTFNSSFHELLSTDNLRTTSVAPQESHTSQAETTSCGLQPPVTSIRSDTTGSGLQQPVTSIRSDTTSSVNVQSTGQNNSSSGSFTTTNVVSNINVPDTRKETSNNKSESETLQEVRSMRIDMKNGFKKIFKMLDNELNKPAPTKPSFLPFKHPDEVHSFQKASKSQFDRLVAYLRYLGGTTLPDAVSLQFKETITPSCAFYFTLYGKNARRVLRENEKPCKTRLYDTKLYKALYCGVSKAHAPSDDEFLKLFSERLRSAKQTYRNQMNRQLRGRLSGECSNSASRGNDRRNHSRSRSESFESRERSKSSEHHEARQRSRSRSSHQSRQGSPRHRHNRSRARSESFSPFESRERSKSSEDHRARRRSRSRSSYLPRQGDPRHHPRDRQNRSRSRSERCPLNDLREKSKTRNRRDTQRSRSRSNHQARHGTPQDRQNRSRSRSKRCSAVDLPENTPYRRHSERQRSRSLLSYQSRQSSPRASSKENSSSEISERSTPHEESRSSKKFVRKHKQQESQKYKGRNWENDSSDDEDSELNLYEDIVLDRSRSPSLSN